MGEQSTQDRSIDLTKEGGIIFNEKEHTYKNDKGKFYTGITTLLGNYYEHFDSDKVSINKAIKDVVIDTFGNKKYKDVISQMGGDVVISEIYKTNLKFGKNKEYVPSNFENYIFDFLSNKVNDYKLYDVLNSSIKECVLNEHGETKYLELEKQVKGSDNLFKKLNAIKTHKEDLYDTIFESILKKYAITIYGGEKYSILSKQVGGFENLFTKMDEFENKKPKLFKKIKKLIDWLKADWKATNLRATTEGSLEHDKREQQIYDDGGYMYKGIWFKYVEGKNISNVTLDDTIVIPECMVWNHDMELGGLADIFLFHKGTIYVLDYKTNALIETKPKIDNPQFWKYMFGVCSELLDLNFYHYSLQLKIYQMMAILLRPEFKAGENIIIFTSSKTHYRDVDAEYECHNVEEIVPKIFEDVKKKLEG